jgi:hypothetical protein
LFLDGKKACMASGRNNNGAVTVVWLMVAAVVLAALYFWLIGQWFARVVMFLCLSAVLGLFAGMAMLSGGNLAVFGAVVVAAAVSWYASGIPMYYWNARNRQLAMASAVTGRAY